MKFLQKSLAVLALLSISGSAFGYKWVFNNRTDKPLMVSMALKGSVGSRFWHTVAPGSRAIFEWGFPYCYREIQITDFDPIEARKIDARLGSLKMNAEYGDNSPDYIKKYFDYKTWQTPQIFYPKSTVDYKKIEDALGKITDATLKGIDLAVIGATGAEGAPVDPKLGELGLGAAIGSLTGLIGEAIETSACVSRTLDIESATVKNRGTSKNEKRYVLVSYAN